MGIQPRLKTVPTAFATLLLVGISISSSAAPIYKCIDNAGKTTYQSHTCPDSARSSRLDIRTAYVMPELSGQFSLAEMKKAVLTSCIGNAGRQANPTLRKIANEQPRKFQSFCECVADTSMTDVEKVKALIANNDRAALGQLGFRAGVICEPMLH